MVLAGIAGRTIEEAKENMPVEEIPVWRAYIQRNGPLSLQRRLDYATAQIAAILANQNRDPKKPPLGLKDFLLWRKDEEMIDQSEDLQQAFGEIMKVSGHRRDRGKPAKRLWVRQSS